jgi:hypothetical protein
MQLSSLSLALTRAGFLTTAAFSPASLFAAGEQGAWYDPSDSTTLFQDRAGTTPVTAVEQPVGLMLDKSKGLVLGSQLFSDFATEGPWTDNNNGSWSITNAASNSDLRTATLGATDKRYEVRFTLTGISGSVLVYPLSTTPITYTTNGNFVVRDIANSGAVGNQLWFRAAIGSSVTVSNISVRELPGNHAFQSTAASRPVLSARVNQLLATEDFSSASWIKVNATVESTPDSNAPGAMYAIRSANDAISSSTRYVGQSIAIGTLTSYKATFYTKAGGQTSIRFLTRNDDTTRGATFNLQTGQVSATEGGATASISLVNGGIYRCEVTWTSGGDSSILPVFQTATPVFGDGSIMFYVSAPDLRASNDGVGLPAYQRVNTSTDYDAGPEWPKFLRFDGVDDSLQTNSINFTATDKMTVWAGVRKFVNSANCIVYELSPDINANNGGFGLFAPLAEGGLQTYSAISKGTVVASAGTGASAYLAPITNTTTHTADISSDLLSLRVNGTQAASNTADQGTGPYGNYPLYIGRRGGSSLPFNGRLHSLIVRGAQSTTQQIEQTEAYVNARTKAF